MRLIDADSLYSRIKTHTNPYGKPTLDYESGVKVLDMIKQESTVDIKTEVARGIINEIEEWVNVYNGVGYVSVPMHKLKSLITELENKYTKEGVGE